MNWYHSLEHIELNSPSRSDGVDFETEVRYRKEGTQFIMQLGHKLGLRYLPIATGWVFFHRFYMFHSFKEFPRWVTGATCLFLAGKVEETPKKCKNILKYAQQVLEENKFKTFGENPREELMVCERVLLQTIKFDLQLNHPYQYLIKYGKLLKGEKEKINDLIQKAWTFINESFMSTTLCLVYKPQVLALAVLVLAIKRNKENIQEYISTRKHFEWWKMFYTSTSELELEEVCRELTQMIEGKPPKKFHEKRKENENVTNSPQLSGSPKTKKSKHGIIGPSSLDSFETNSNDSSKPLVNGTEKIDSADSGVESALSSLNDSKLDTPNAMLRMRRMSSKQGSQTPEEMDLERLSPDLQTVELAELLTSKGHGFQHYHHHHHHNKNKESHQPVTLQQVQAQQHKQMQKQTQKQKLLLHRKHITPNKHLASSSSLAKMPTLTPIKQPSMQKDSAVTQQDTPPDISTINSIQKQLLITLAASQKSNLATLQKQASVSPTKSSKTTHEQIQPKQKQNMKQQQKQRSLQHKTEQDQGSQKAQLSQYKNQSVPSLLQQQKNSQHLKQQQQIEQKQKQNMGQDLSQQHEQKLHIDQDRVKHHTQLSQAQLNSQGSPHVQQAGTATNSPAQSTVEQSSHSSTPNVSDANQSAPPILDHMSSFFQSNQTFSYPSQSYNYQQTSFPTAPPFPQPTLPQGLPQPPPGYSQSNYMTSGQQYPNSSTQTYSTFSSTQPQLLLPPPPTIFHGTPWL